MQRASAGASTKPSESSAMDSAQLAALVQTQAERIVALEHQLDWFRRQIFGAKSERFAPEPNPAQLHLGEIPFSVNPPEANKPVAAHARRAARSEAEAGEELTFFDESKLPVQTLTLLPPEVQGLSADQYEVIGEKLTYRVAQRPGAYHILKICRPVIKLKMSQQIVAVPAPEAVLGESRADVSFAAGLLMDKFAWHLPLYRQHQRLAACGIRVSRPWLTQLAQNLISLLAPIYDAQMASIRASRVKAMDETPIKAGRSGHGKMHTGYFWPIYGEQDEVCFPFHTSRAGDFVAAALGLSPVLKSILVTDGYAAYTEYAEKTGISHARCWSHARRTFFEALTAEPDAAAEALERIKVLYAIEEDIRNKTLLGEAKQLHRLTHSKPIVELFFEWVDSQLARQGFTPSNPFIKALNYVRKRRVGLEVFLTDPDVPIDTNHLERALRAIPMGRKAWLFCWTELGAKHVGIIQSLIVTCRLHHIDPYTYLVDVLQRVSEHPASRVAELTPRLWKQHFAANPLRSDIHEFPV